MGELHKTRRIKDKCADEQAQEIIDLVMYVLGPLFYEVRKLRSRIEELENAKKKNRN